MPNWCECDLVIEGDPKDLASFKAKAKHDDRCLSEESFIPYPTKFREMDRIAAEYIKTRGWGTAPKDGFNSGGYEWCIKNWGTKWGICNPTIVPVDEGRKIEYAFKCAWGPCLPVIAKMAEDFPNLSFNLQYFECGMEFKGFQRYENGELEDSGESEYHGNRGG